MCRAKHSRCGGWRLNPNTDDMREAPSRVIIEALWEKGASVRAYDPEAMKECHRIYGDRDDLILCDHQNDALDGGDALIIVTEWKNFRAVNLSNLKKMMNNPVIFDGRNIYDPKDMVDEGFVYYSIGR